MTSRAPALAYGTANPAATSSISRSVSSDATAVPVIEGRSTVLQVPIPRRGVDYRRKIVLAPMVRSGELPSRLLALHYGADLVWGPETVDKSMIGTTMRTNPRTGCLEWTRKQNNGLKASEVGEQSDVEDSIIYRIDPKRESNRLIYQIGTADPVTAVASASLVAPYVAGIDVNAGCPKPFSTSGGMGAALLKTPDHLASILRALIEEVGRPNEIGISVKIRLLETPEKTRHLVTTLCKTGIIGLTIHCRTTPMRPRERAIREQLRMIREICHDHGVACLMNGDVTSRDDGLALAKEYGCDGAMIATAAEANSSAFRSKADGGLAPWPEVVKQYVDFAISVENRLRNTKFLLTQLIPGKNPVFQKVAQSRCYLDLLKVLEITDEVVVNGAKRVDEVLQLNGTRITKADIKRMNKEKAKEAQEQKAERIRLGLQLPDSQRKHQHQRSQQQQDQAQLQKRKRSQSRSPERKARIAAANAGFDGVGEGALAVAV